MASCIIAVHGIETISPKTWIAYEQDTEPKGRCFNWLQDEDMLPSVIKGARIWTFDYNSNYSHDAQTVRIDGLAATLLNCIKDRHADFKARKILFIGSCFGGIVVAEALLTASREMEDERKKAVFTQTAGVVFLGSPLRGTNAATFAGWKNLVFGILGPAQESSCTLLDDLKANSSRLESLVAEFGKLTVQSRMQAGMEIRCFYETRKTQVFNSISRNSLIKPQEMLLVDKVSACLDCHEHIPLNVRHAMMNKYRGPEDPNFKLVSGRIKDIIEKIRTDRPLTHEEQKCMQALSFPYQNQKDLNPKRVDGTCEWFLHHQKFLAWRQGTTADLLWVTAGPGCGKSVLSKALVDEGLIYSKEPDTKTTSICYFFFKDDVERGSGVNALRSILHQLFRQKPWLIQKAIADCQVFGRDLPFRKLWDILIKAIADTNTGPVICVFDALDECEPLTRTSLIKNISSFYRDLNTSSLQLKFIVTSRPLYELEIEFEVDDLPSIHLEGNEMSENISKEVDLVIRHEVSRISNARQPPLNVETQEGLIQHLKNQNNRTYLWVHLMLHEIRRSLESTERKLKQLLNTMPSSVDEAYKKILNRATDPDRAKRVLHLILAAERPLTLKEMNVALEIIDMKERGDKCISQDDLELDREESFRKKIENLCGLFVSIVDQRIYLIHQTAKEFLINNDSNINPWSPSCWKHTITLEASHLEVLKACLWYLQLEFPGFAPDMPRDVFLSQVAQYCPLLSYASMYWTFHFRKAEKKADESLVRDALQLCDTTSQRFSLWQQVLASRFQNNRKGARNGLLVACYFGLTTAVQLVLEGKSNINSDPNAKDEGQTPLWRAIENGHEGIVKLLLNRGEVDADAKNDYGQTPLMKAAWHGHETIVKLLLNRGEVDANAKTHGGQTPLLLAAGWHKEIVKLLLESGKVDADTKNVYGQTPLLLAAVEGQKEIVKLLLNTSKVDINAKDNHKTTPLLGAAKNSHKEVVELLLNTGKADPNTKDNEGRTSLWCAIQNRQYTVVELLLNTGQVDLDVKDKYGRTPLWWAIENRNNIIIKLLLDTGKVDPDAIDNRGRTPLWWAIKRKNDTIIKLLLDTGKVNTDIMDPEKWKLLL